MYTSQAPKSSGYGQAVVIFFGQEIRIWSGNGQQGGGEHVTNPGMAFWTLSPGACQGEPVAG
jgi:hypothetical protein